MVNSAQITIGHVRAQMMLDGLGPDEVLDHLPEYSRAITGNMSKTACARIAMLARRIAKEGVP